MTQQHWNTSKLVANSLWQIPLYFILAYSILACSFSEADHNSIDLRLIEDTDSLYGIWLNKDLPDSIRLQAKYNMAWWLTSTNNDSAINIALDLEAEADALDMKDFALRSRISAAFFDSDIPVLIASRKQATQFGSWRTIVLANAALSRFSNLPELSLDLNRLIHIVDSVFQYHTDSELEKVSNAMIGWGHANKREYHKGLSRLYLSLELDKNLPYYHKLASYGGLSICHQLLNNHEDAYKTNIEFVEESIRRNSEVDLQAAMANLSNVCLHLKKYDEAAEAALREYELATKFESVDAKFRYEVLIGEIQLRQKKYNEALITLNSALRELNSNSRNYVFYYGATCSFIAEAYNGLSQWNKAENYADTAIAFLYAMNFAQYEKLARFELAKAKLNLKQYQAYADNMERYHLLNDSLEEISSTRNTALLEAEFKFQQEKDSILTVNIENRLKDQHQITKQRYQRNLFIAGSGLLLFVAIGLFSRYRVVGKKNQIISREKERSEELLLNILPKATAEELKATGVAKAQRFEEVTVLYSDIKDFTKIGDSFSPEELVSELNHCFSAFDKILSNYKVEKIKSVGDAYLCVGGLPLSYEDSVIETLKVALEMQAFMKSYALKRRAAGKAYFEIRIGIHTGPVVAGIVGIKKYTYDIWGDTVNTAARMEQACDVGKINISEWTKNKLETSQFKIESRGKIAVKGKGELEMYYLDQAEQPIS